MDITKREVIASITIIAVMLLLGVMISGRIYQSQMEHNAKYNKAVKIESTDMFRYGMDTNIGNAFIYGDLEAVDPVTFPEIGGSYLSVKKVKEEYTMHTRIVTTTDSKGRSHSHTETYWTWDEVWQDNIQAKKIRFCGIEFDASQLNLPWRGHITTISEGFSVRYEYYGSPVKTTGTVFTYLKDGNIGGDDTKYYQDLKIADTVERLESRGEVGFFWLLWVVLTGGIVAMFYFAENRWLH